VPKKRKKRGRLEEVKHIRAPAAFRPAIKSVLTILGSPEHQCHNFFLRRHNSLLGIVALILATDLQSDQPGKIVRSCSNIIARSALKLAKWEQE
jgi:hypothetical protein